MKTGFAVVMTTAAMFVAGAVAFGADAAAEKRTVTLRSGRALQDAYILDKKPNGITIAYKDGCMFVPFSDMPLEFQQIFGYEPIKSARYEKKLDERKKASAKEESERKAREKKRKADEDKHYRNPYVNTQQQIVRKLEAQLEDAKKRLAATKGAVGQDRNASAGISSVGPNGACIESPWGYGGRIRSGAHSAAVTNKFVKETDASNANRDKQVQDVIDLQLKLEAAQIALDEMLAGE